MILLVGKRRAPKPQRIVAAIWAHGASPSQRGQARHGAHTAAGQIEPRPRPGGAPIVFAGDAVKRPYRLGRGRGPRRRLVSHILPPELGTPLEQAVWVFRGVVDPGWG